MAPEWGDGIAGALRLLPTRASERSNGMERREFIALIAGGLASFALPRFALADGSFGGEGGSGGNVQIDNPELVVESIAFGMAETFFSAIEPSKEIKAVSATPNVRPVWRGDRLYRSCRC